MIGKYKNVHYNMVVIICELKGIMSNVKNNH